MAHAEAAIGAGNYDDAENYAIRAQALIAARPKMAKGGIAGVSVEYDPQQIENFLVQVRKLRGRVAIAANPSGKILKIRHKAIS